MPISAMSPKMKPKKKATMVTFLRAESEYISSKKSLGSFEGNVPLISIVMIVGAIEKSATSDFSIFNRMFSFQRVIRETSEVNQATLRLRDTFVIKIGKKDPFKLAASYY